MIAIEAYAIGFAALCAMIPLAAARIFGHRNRAAGHAPAWDPSDPWQGTSPAAEAAHIDEQLTPTELMPRAPVTLDDGTVVGTPDRPTMTTIEADAEHAITALLDEKLADVRWRIDFLIKAAEQGKSVRVAWAEAPTGAWPIVGVAA